MAVQPTVTWNAVETDGDSIGNGTIDPQYGIYTAPVFGDNQFDGQSDAVSVSASSGSVSGSASVTVTPDPPPTFAVQPSATLDPGGAWPYSPRSARTPRVPPT